MARETMNVVIVGHVDHGKSTLVGRLLADTGTLGDGKLEKIRAVCKQQGKVFEYAFLLDALEEEQGQGITIDSARVFFRTERRDYIIIDAPGHIEFLKNMVSGAARAEAAVLLIDAKEGVRENSRRHGYLLSMLGIKQIVVAVNKIDLLGYEREAFEGIVREYRAFLGEVGVEPTHFVPISAREGDFVATRTPNLAWFDGPTILEAMDGFAKKRPSGELPLRMPVQDVYKFNERGDDRRIIVGRVESGTLRMGDRVMFSPSYKTTTIESVQTFHAAV
ncbi:MAG TPA: GTP-binding protein, partial [Haliangium sp.]|nr:GTP-binding protein [Haliangium sp.]